MLLGAVDIGALRIDIKQTLEFFPCFFPVPEPQITKSQFKLCIRIFVRFWKSKYFFKIDHRRFVLAEGVMRFTNPVLGVIRQIVTGIRGQ